jgi:cytochrome c
VPAVDPGVQAQVQRGAVVYAQACARCHGARGEGGAAPVLIGAAALPLQPRPGALVRTTPLRNAMDLGMFIKDQMPPGGPPTPPSDVAAVMAWILTSSGVTPPQAISPATAGGIRIR